MTSRHNSCPPHSNHTIIKYLLLSINRYSITSGVKANISSWPYLDSIQHMVICPYCMSKSNVNSFYLLGHAFPVYGDQPHWDQWPISTWDLVHWKQLEQRRLLLYCTFLKTKSWAHINVLSNVTHGTCILVWELI